MPFANLLLTPIGRRASRLVVAFFEKTSSHSFSFGISILGAGSMTRSALAGCVMSARQRGLAHVMFEQHPAENCILDCSKCLFVVACGNI
jgi:hypothetical protein